MDIDELDDTVLNAVLQHIGGDWDDEPEKLQKKLDRIYRMNGRELFDRFLLWHGFIGYTDMIINAYEATIGAENAKIPNSNN